MSKIKRILCYGDSITWGYNYIDGSRYDFELTWPGVMEKTLGNNYRIITEAITGRTTCWDVPYAPYRNGKEYLPMLMESHSPLDLVIVMLGLNDLMKMVGKTADESAWGLISLVRIILSPVFGGIPPKLLIVAPPSVCKLSEFNAMVFADAIEESKKLAEKFKSVANEVKCEFLDSNEFIKITGSDGLHPLPEQHRILGQAIAEKIISIKF